MRKLNYKGFSAVEVILLIVIVGLLGFVGWRVWDAGKSEETQETEQATQNTEENKEQPTEEEIKKINGISYSVPLGWKNSSTPTEPFETYENGNGNYLLSPDYKAGGAQFFIESGASISFSKSSWLDLKSKTTLEEALTIVKESEGYFDAKSAEIAKSGDNEVILYDSGHTTDGVTALYKTTSGMWLEADFTTTTGDDGEYNAQDSEHYPVFIEWLERFTELN